MNENLEKAKGKIDEVTGSVTGNDTLEAKGKLEQKSADIKGSVHDATDTIADKANDVMDRHDN